MAITATITISVLVSLLLMTTDDPPYHNPYIECVMFQISPHICNGGKGEVAQHAEQEREHQFHLWVQEQGGAKNDADLSFMRRMYHATDRTELKQ